MKQSLWLALRMAYLSKIRWKMHSFPKAVIILLSLIVLSKMMVAQNSVKTTVFDTLYALDVQRLEVELNLDSLLLNKLTNKEWPCTLKVILSDDHTFSLPLSISVRSKSRRRYCDFPPLKFDFDKSDLEDFGLDNEDEYKIVTHCLETNEGEEVLLKEFLTYQLFQLITPQSLRAKLVDIIYIDSASDRKVQKKAIFLESEKEFARTQKGELCDCMGTPKDSLDAMKYEIVAMFQYMIGNIDMDYLVERNVTLIKPKSGDKWLPVAYDFDFAAFVNAPYVHTKVKDNKTLRRTYLGFKENESFLPEVIELFQSKEDEIETFIKNYELISASERRDCLKYVRDFYREISTKPLALPYRN